MADFLKDIIIDGQLQTNERIYTLGGIRITGGIYDQNNSIGTAGQLLTSDGTNVEWVNTSQILGTQSNVTYYDVKNTTGATISKGKVVMAVGTDGNSGHILIDEMVADGSVEPRYILGVLNEDIAHGTTGQAIYLGQIKQLNTTGQNGETWSDGTVLWCDPNSPGDLTQTEPNGPNLKIPVAIVLNAATNGKIQVRATYNEGIHDLHDTKIVNQVDGDILVWDNTTGVWFNDSTLNVDQGVGVDITGNLDVSGTGTFGGDLTINNISADAVLNLNTSAGNARNFRIYNNGSNLYTKLMTNVGASFIWEAFDGTDVFLISSTGNIVANGSGTFGDVINMPDNKAVIWSGGSIRAEGTVLKLGGGTLINLQQNTSITGTLNVSSSTTLGGHLWMSGFQVNGASRVQIGNTTFTQSGDQNHVHFNGSALMGQTTTGTSNADLGRSDYRWNGIYGVTGDFSNTITVGGLATFNSQIVLNASQMIRDNANNGILSQSGSGTSRVLDIGNATYAEYNFSTGSVSASLFKGAIEAPRTYNLSDVNLIKPEGVTFNWFDDTITDSPFVGGNDANGVMTLGTLTNTNYASQLAFSNNTRRLAFRSKDNGTWTAWSEVATQEWVTTNYPEFIHNDIAYYEAAHTNLVPSSEDFNTGWTKITGATVTSNTQVAPDGTTTGDTVAHGGSNDLVLRYSGLVTPGVLYNYSIWAKAGTSSVVMIDVGDQGTTSFNLTSEWQRISVSATSINQNFIDIAIPGGSLGDTVHVWGAQLTVGNTLHSYTKTSGSTVSVLEGINTSWRNITANNIVANGEVKSNQFRTENSGRVYLWETHDLNYIKYDNWQSAASAGMTISNLSGAINLSTTVGNISLLPDAHVYLGNAGKGNRLYHYSNLNDGIYTTYDHTATQATYNTTASAGFKFEDDVTINGQLKIDPGHYIDTDLIRTNEVRTLGGQQIVVNVGESHAYATGQTNEFLYVNSESGVEINYSPDNWVSLWAGRKTHTIGQSVNFSAVTSIDGGNLNLRNTNGGTNALWISRFTSNAEGMKAYIDDGHAIFESYQDEIGTQNGGFRFRMQPDKTSAAIPYFRIEDSTTTLAQFGRDAIIFRHGSRAVTIDDSSGASFTDITVDGNLRIHSGSSANTYIGSNNVDAIHIDTSQDVNILNDLDVSGTGTFGDDVTISHANGDIRFNVGSSNQIIETDGGLNLGAGTGNVRVTNYGVNSELQIDDTNQANKIVLKSVGTSYFTDLLEARGGLDVTGNLDVSGNLTTNGADAFFNSDIHLNKDSAGNSIGSHTIRFHGTNSSGSNTEQAQIESSVYPTNTNGGRLNFYTFDSASVKQLAGYFDGDQDLVLEADLRIKDSKFLRIGSSGNGDVLAYHDGSDNYWQVANGNMYWFMSNNNSQIWHTNGVERARINSTQHLLQVPQEIRASVSSGNPILALYNTSNGAGAKIRFSDNTNQGQTGDLTFYHGDTNFSGVNYGAHWKFESNQSPIAVQIPSGGAFIVGDDEVTHEGNISSHIGALNIDADTLDSIDSSQFLRSDVNDIFTGSALTVNNVLRLNANLKVYVGGSDDAHQRVDARSEDTDKARLHWYGRNSADDTNDRFRQAWYDGSKYSYVDVHNLGTTNSSFTFSNSTTTNGAYTQIGLYNSTNRQTVPRQWIRAYRATTFGQGRLAFGANDIEGANIDYFGNFNVTSNLNVTDRINLGGGSVTGQVVQYWQQNDNSSNGWYIGYGGSNENNFGVYGFENANYFIYTNNALALTVDSSQDLILEGTAKIKKNTSVLLTLARNNGASENMNIKFQGSANSRNLGKTTDGFLRWGSSDDASLNEIIATQNWVNSQIQTVDTLQEVVDNGNTSTTDIEMRSNSAIQFYNTGNTLNYQIRNAGDGLNTLVFENNTGQDILTLDNNGNATFLNDAKAGGFTVTNQNPRILFQDATGSTYDWQVRYIDNKLENLWGGGIKSYFDSNSSLWFGDGQTIDSGIRGIKSGTVNNYNELHFWTGGSERMRINEVGNVGIGTTSPGVKLDVDGTARIRDYNDLILNGVSLKGYPNKNLWLIGNENTNVEYTIGTSWNWDLGVSFKYTPYTIGNQTGFLQIGQLQKNSNDWTHGVTSFYVAGSEKMRITSTGNVGIGTTTPAGKLDVNGQVILSGDIEHYIEKDTTSLITAAAVETTTVSGRNVDLYAYDDINFRAGTGDKITMHAGGSERVRIESTGNVGIGTTSPLYKLDVDGDSRINSNGQALTIQGSNHVYLGWRPRGSTRKAYAGFASASTTSFTLMNEDSGNLYLGTGGDIKMTMMSSNNVGIGTTSPSSILHLKDDFSSGVAITLDRTENSVVDSLFYAGVSSNGSVASDFMWLGVSTSHLSLTGTGNVGIGTTNPENALHLVTSTSDATQQLLIQNGGAGDAAIKFNISGDTYSLGIDNSDGDKFKLSAGNLGVNDRLVVDSTGNVGIGTTSPGEKLHVAGNLILNNAGEGWIKGYDDYHSIKFRAGGTNKTEYYEYGGTLAAGLGHKFFTGGTTGQTLKLQIANDGSYFSSNVGIGTTSPQGPLDVYVASGNANAYIRSNTDNAYLHIDSGLDGVSKEESGIIFSDNGSARWAIYKDSGDDFSIYDYTGGYKAFEILDNGRMDLMPGAAKDVTLVTGGGNVGIGTTSPGVKLDVAGIVASRLGGSSSSALSVGVLEITSSSTPTQIKITTNIPYSGGATHAHSVTIRGFQYGNANTVDLQISWHVYNNSFYNRAITSSGGWAPTVRLAVENNKVVIHLANPGYWPKMYVESLYNAYGSSAHAQGWSWSDAAISADANTPNELVPYKINFGNGFSMDSSGNVGIGTTSPTAKLDVNGGINVTGNIQTSDLGKIGLVSQGHYLFFSDANNTASFVGVDLETGNINSTATVTASSFIKSGGTSSQFLKADGSVDSSTYLTSASLSNYVTTNTTQTISGVKTFISQVDFDSNAQFATNSVIQMGASGQLQLFSDNTNGYLRVFSGKLFLRYDTHNQLEVNSTGVLLNYLGSQKLTTTSGGITITGDSTVTGDYAYSGGDVAQKKGEFDYSTDASTSYTIASTDKGEVIGFTSASAVTVTVNPGSLTDVGDICYIDQMGSGEITITAGTGNSLLKNSSVQLKTNGLYSRVAIHKVSSTGYRVFGELKPV